MKKVKNLKLSRETLRSLTPEVLVAVHAGEDQDPYGGGSTSTFSVPVTVCHP